MANRNNSNKGNGENGDRAGVILALIPIITPIIKPAVDKIVDIIQSEKHNNKDNLIAIPQLYDEDFPVELEQAEKLLNSLGLKTMSSKLSIEKANVKFRRMSHNQVIDTIPKQKQKVEPGTIVVIHYITQDVIDRSQELYNQDKMKKSEDKQKQKIVEKIKRVLPRHTKEEP